MKLKNCLLAMVAVTAAVMMASAPIQAQTTYTAKAGVSLITTVSATATQTSGVVRLPNGTGSGILNVTESGITGSPSGCTLALAYEANNASTAGSTVATIAFTPSTGVQQLNVTPSVPLGDNYVLTYACSSTYPTAGLISVSFTGVDAVSADPCFTSAKSNVAISVSSATTTQLVALSAGKSIYVCAITVSSVGGTSTFEYGTGSNCATGTTTLTGAFPAAATVPIGSGPSTAFATPAGNALCILSGASTTGTAGVVTYVQQ